MTRSLRRKEQRALDAIMSKAKEEMYDWALGLGHPPTLVEVQAWKSGYISGVNRGSEIK
jgi:hypothetical protein